MHTGSDDSQAEVEVVRDEASGSGQEVSHAVMQSRFAEVSRFAQPEVSHSQAEAREKGSESCRGFRCV